jgi:hypothetical protein
MIVNRMFLMLALTAILAACATAPNANQQRKPWHAVPLADVRITADRATDDRQQQRVVIYGNGVAVWNNRLQFGIAEEDIKRILAAFDAASFDTVSLTNKGKILRRRAAIRAGSYEREQWETWEQELIRLDELETKNRLRERQGLEREPVVDPPLATLVDSIINSVLPMVEKGGTTADSLADGLRKIASGELAPETLSVTMLVKPEPGHPGETGGFTFQIADATASTSDFQGEERGFAAPRSVKLSPARLRELASRLASLDPESLPGNLYSPKYEQILISVLNHEKSILARPFAGLTPEKHGQAQKRFDEMASWLDSTRGELFGGKH